MCKRGCYPKHAFAFPAQMLFRLKLRDISHQCSINKEKASVPGFASASISEFAIRLMTVCVCVCVRALLILELCLIYSIAMLRNTPLDFITLECSSCNSGRGLRLVRYAVRAPKIPNISNWQCGDFTPVSGQRCIPVLPLNHLAGQWFRMDGPREGNAGRMGSKKSSCCDLPTGDSEEDQLVEMREDL